MRTHCCGHVTDALVAEAPPAEPHRAPLGVAVIGGHRVPVIGRVSMDLITLDVSELPDELVQAGQLVDLIGDRTGRIVPIYPQSEKAQLNTWELAGWIVSCMRRAVSGNPSSSRWPTRSSILKQVNRAPSLRTWRWFPRAQPQPSRR